MTKTKPKMADITVADLRSLRAELREEHEWRMRLHGEKDEFEAQLKTMNEARSYICQVLIAERQSLGNRVHQIGLLLHLLGRGRAES